MPFLALVAMFQSMPRALVAPSVMTPCITLLHGIWRMHSKAYTVTTNVVVCYHLSGNMTAPTLHAVILPSICIHAIQLSATSCNFKPDVRTTRQVGFRCTIFHFGSV